MRLSAFQSVTINQSSLTHRSDMLWHQENTQTHKGGTQYGANEEIIHYPRAFGLLPSACAWWITSGNCFSHLINVT